MVSGAGFGELLRVSFDIDTDGRELRREPVLSLITLFDDVKPIRANVCKL